MLRKTNRYTVDLLRTGVATRPYRVDFERLAQAIPNRIIRHNLQVLLREFDEADRSIADQ